MDVNTDKIKKYNWIDFGRGIAILLVIMVHTGQSFASSNILQRFTESGMMGVQLFFILSAITLFNSYNNRFEKDGEERNKYFFIRRFFRIAPLYYFFAVFYTVLKIFLQGVHSVLYWKVIISVLFLNGFILSAINYIPPGGWSIGIEMIFYCMIPFLFQKVKTIKGSIYLLIATILFSNLLNYLDKYLITNFTGYNFASLRKLNGALYFWIPNQLPVFCFGILLYNIFKSAKFKRKIQVLCLVTSVLLFLVFTQFNFSIEYPYYFLQPEYMYSIAFVLFIIGIKDYQFNTKIGNIFLLIGKYSFCMYLAHFGVCKMFYSLTHRFFGFEMKDKYFPLSYVSIVSISFICAFLLHKLERLGIDYGNRIIENKKSKLIFGKVVVQTSVH
jgi:peptidoglycan/LPS O-acetylase OafA/YrhL